MKKKNNSYHFWVFNVTTVLESVLTVSHDKKLLWPNGSSERPNILQIV